MKRLIVLLAVMGVAVGLLAYSRMRTSAPRISGFIEADEIRVGSRVGGRVAEVLVSEGEAVRSGQALMRLDPYDLQERLAEAKAQLAARTAVYEKLKAGLRPEEIAQAQAKVDGLTATVAKLVAGPRAEEIAAANSRLQLANAQLDRTNRSNDRLQGLYKRDPNSVSREDLDRAVEEMKVAEANVRVREEELQLLKHGTREEEKAEARAQLEQARQALQMATNGFRAEEIAEAQAAMTAAQATVAAVEVQLRELDIRSGIDGVVEALELRPGDLVAPGGPVLSILDTGRMWVRAYLPENRLDVKVGDSLDVTVDSFPGQRLTGRVTFVSTQAEFTPRNVQTAEERSKQVFRIKVEVADPEKKLRAGMAADVWLPQR